MQPWWDEWPEVVEDEEEAFSRHGYAMTLRRAENGEPTFIGTVTVHGRELRLEVQYPSGYPCLPPSVIARGGLEDLDRHISPTGVVCLLGREDRTWTRAETAADLIATQMDELLRLHEAGPDAMRGAEDPQGEPFSSWYHYEPNVAALVDDQVRDFARQRQGGRLTIYATNGGTWLAGDSPPGQLVVTAIREDATGGDETRSDLCSDGLRLDAPWIRLEVPPDPTASDDKIFDWICESGALKPRYFAVGKSGFEVAVVAAIFPEEVRQGQHGDGWIFAVRFRQASRRTGGRGGRQAARAALVRAIPSGRSDLAERLPTLKGLGDKHVLVVGLGTLGSSIARELARAQVGILSLIDHDYAEAGPSVRWELGMSAVGYRKADALKAVIEADYPFTEVRAYVDRVGRSSDGDRPFQEALATADLVIDATAERNATSIIALRALQFEVPLITLWSVGGHGGVVGQFAAGGACYFCFERTETEGQSITDQITPTVPNLLQPRSCADTTFAAASVDLRDLSTHAVRMGLAVLSGSEYGEYRHHIYLNVHRTPDGTLVDPPVWKAHDVDVHPSCPCHTEAPSPDHAPGAG